MDGGGGDGGGGVGGGGVGGGGAGGGGVGGGGEGGGGGGGGDGGGAALSAGEERSRPKYAWDSDVEPPPPRVTAASLTAARSPPLSRGTGAAAFTPSLWQTPGATRRSGFAASLAYPSPGVSGAARLGLDQATVTPALSRGEPRRGGL